jgi:transcription initiation factor TFIID TATA-box-binding protein
MIDNQQDPEIELFVNNVVCSFALGCKLNLRKIAMEAANVIYKRENAVCGFIVMIINIKLFFYLDGTDEDAKSILFSQRLVVGQSDSNRNDKVCVKGKFSSSSITYMCTLRRISSEDDAQRAARRVARCLQRLGYKTKFRNFRVVNCLATCSMPWPIDIVKLSRTYSEYVR